MGREKKYVIVYKVFTKKRSHEKTDIFKFLIRIIKMLWPLNCLTHIMSYLSYTDLHRFCQINNYMANLKHKDIVWQTLFNRQYPDNHIYADLTPYQNYLRLSLVRKFLDLNFKYFEHWQGHHITHSGTPKRHPNRALSFL